VGDWSADGGADAPRLRAAAGKVAIDLQLQTRKPVVLQGDRGWSRKGVEPGNASYYYSFTRLAATGVVTVGGDRHLVSGLAWMDREWGTSALEADQVGWDWFALQLGDGREVMFYRLRRRDGTTHPMSRGSLVGQDGSTRGLAPDAVRIDTLDSWRSPRSAARYPSRWRVQVPGEGLDLVVTPHLADQELALALRYWEGAVSVAGAADGRAVGGNGYVELTGYAEVP
jgi:predicted secreted hydrolase